MWKQVQNGYTSTNKKSTDYLQQLPIEQTQTNKRVESFASQSFQPFYWFGFERKALWDCYRLMVYLIAKC
ncbi:MAG: hypothetical protein DCF19_08125 [Pseudanabaena frigida]|uniref:Uncharacterized protein n=1 Tax=Pseudanabaena frigida TaxID=945775 RepID=A0A2W4WG70_9CYAN|nr:MAG: hypothetical protein DCF19_08125 [Pseudanabaena frigida]